MIITQSAASQPSSKKSKLVGGAYPATVLATTDSGDCSDKSILSDRIFTDNEYLSRNSIFSSA